MKIATIIGARRAPFQGRPGRGPLHDSRHLHRGQPLRQKKNPNEPQVAFDIMDRAMLKIQEIDTSAWTEEDNITFRDSLTNLKTEIDNYLNPPPKLDTL